MSEEHKYSGMHSHHINVAHEAITDNLANKTSDN